MDLNNNNQDQETQLKDLLDKYSDEINQQVQSEVKPAESQPLSNLELESGSNITLGSGFESQIPSKNEMEISTPEPTLLPPPVENLSEPNLIQNKAKTNFPKILFFVSLFIFLIVLSFLVFVFLNKPKIESNIPSNQPTPSPTSAVTGGFCNLNDKQYAVGETFPAADGCNTCSCNPDLYIVCTEKACEEIIPIPTIATKAATVKPTKSSY